MDIAITECHFTTEAEAINKPVALAA